MNDNVQNIYEISVNLDQNRLSTSPNLVRVREKGTEDILSAFHFDFFIFFLSIVSFCSDNVIDYIGLQAIII